MSRLWGSRKYWAYIPQVRHAEEKLVGYAHLNEILLCPISINSTLGGTTRKLTQEVVGAARWNIRNAHMLRPKGDEVVDGRRIVSFNVCAKELATYIFPTRNC